jgi:hypothetical protein
MPARLADEARLYVGQAHVVGPVVAADNDRVAAAIVGAIDKQPATPMPRIWAKVILVGRSVMPSIIPPIAVRVKWQRPFAGAGESAGAFFVRGPRIGSLPDMTRHEGAAVTA